MTSDAPSYFSQDYQTARARFVQLAEQAGAQLRFIPHPLNGPDGQEIGTDIAVLGPADAALHLVICSATHGIEGYAGSAIQSHLLDTIVRKGFDAPTRLTMIHGLNPWGFAHDRRVTEHNVDLNRNFIDHDAQQWPENPNYAALDKAINPDQLDEETLNAATDLMRTFAKQNGAMALQAAIGQGQYHRPDGCYFGGTKPQWSNRQLRHLIADQCAAATNLIFIDIHTGLGDYGIGELIVEMAPNDPVCQRARTIWGEGVTSTQDGSSSSTALAGTIDFAVIDAAPAAKVTPVTLEFGTVPTEQVFAALRADNWLYRFGDPDGTAYTPIKQALRDAFYPQADDWKQMVIARGVEVYEQALAYFSGAA